MARLGIIADLHEPFTHPLYREFVQDVFAEWAVDKVHFIGDVVDNHATSFWTSHPDGMSAGDEVEATIRAIQPWHKLFPVATVNIGNHDERHARIAQKAGLSLRFLKDYAKVWETPGWDWKFTHSIDGVDLLHGTGNSGKDAAINLAVNRRNSTVIGHTHTWGGVKWHTSHRDRIFGLNVGCGIDVKAYAFEYGRDFKVRPTLGCAVVLDGVGAYFEPMPCGPGEAYHRSRA